MKQIASLLILAAFLAAGCGKDDPENPVPSGSTTDSNPPAVDDDPTLPEADEEDDIATNTFDRTITITFAVTAPGLSSGYKGVSVSGESFCSGTLATGGISGGTAVSLENYTSGGGFPGGGGGGNPGGGGVPGGGGGRP